MKTPRKTRCAPEWREEPGTGARPCTQPPVRIDPDTAYVIGLLCQTLSDAGAAGLTFVELGAKTSLGAVELKRVLRIAVARAFVRKLRDGRFVAREHAPPRGSPGSDRT